MDNTGTPNTHDTIEQSNREEKAPAEPRDESKSGHTKPASRRIAYFAQSIRRDHNDFILLICAFISGIVDSTMFVTYATFVSMQTGNTIFVALGASHQDVRPYSWLKSLLAIICFSLGAILFSRLNLFLAPARRRGTLVLSFLIQTIFTLAAAATVQSGAIDGSVPPIAPEAIEFNQLAPIALLSFQSAGQIVASRGLELGELPTVVVTSLLCDLWSDPLVLAPFSKNVKRNRRTSAFFLTLVGAIVGGWVCEGTKGMQAAIWIAGGLKGVITVAWCLWPAEKKTGSNNV